MPLHPLVPSPAGLPADLIAKQLLGMRVAGLVYISGPMSGYVDYNFPAFFAAAELLQAQGHEVVNPADHGLIEGAGWDDYMRYNLARMMRCEVIALLPGWSRSRGAQQEKQIAEALGLTVRYLPDAEQVSTTDSLGLLPPGDWRGVGNLLYMLKDGINHYEINVHQVAGARTPEACEPFAADLLRKLLATRQAGPDLSAAVADVLAERRRQVEDEQFDDSHDDMATRGQLAAAAACYAAGSTGSPRTDGLLKALWPWDRYWWKPAAPRRMLVKAAALIIAEIERIDRKARRTNQGEEHV